MKRISVYLSGMLLVFSVSGTAHAALIPTHYVYDDCLDITWLGDANYAQTSGYDSDGQMDWWQADAWALQLDYAGHTDWRLATIDELAHLYNVEGVSSDNPGPFVNGQHDWYWSGTEYNYPGADDAWLFVMYNGSQAWIIKDFNFYAWPVRPGQVSTIPIPPAVWLLGSGLIGLIGFRRKFR